MRRHIVFWFLVVGFSSLCSIEGYAQGFSWPEEPDNLQALPASVKGRELGSLMRGFTSALDVRCEYCHASKAGQELDPRDLTTFDFAADDNEKKLTSRAMIRMVRDINENHLEKIGVADSRR